MRSVVHKIVISLAVAQGKSSLSPTYKPRYGMLGRHHRLLIDFTIIYW